MDLNFKGRTALVSSASGIGVGAARALTWDGFHIVMPARHHDLLQHIVGQIGTPGIDRPIHTTGDVTVAWNVVRIAAETSDAATSAANKSSRSSTRLRKATVPSSTSTSPSATYASRKALAI